MKNFERITKRDEDGKVRVPLANAYYIMQAYERLAELEDKLGSGQLMELPCKIGDTVYWCNGLTVTPYRVDGFADYGDGLGLRLLIEEMQPSISGLQGKDLFFNKKQAEAKLKELTESKNA